MRRHKILFASGKCKFNLKHYRKNFSHCSRIFLKFFLFLQAKNLILTFLFPNTVYINRVQKRWRNQVISRTILKRSLINLFIYYNCHCKDQNDKVRMLSQKYLSNTKLVHNRTKRNSLDDRTVFYYCLQYFEKHRLFGLQRHINLKNGRIPYGFPIWRKSGGNFIVDRVRCLWPWK